MMFVIPFAIDALRARLLSRPRRRPAYVRKPKVTGRRVYARPVSHRADSRRPSYSHPVSRVRRAITGRRAPTVAKRRARPQRRDAVPRDTRAVGRAIVKYVPRTINASVRAWLTDQAHARRSHRHPDAGHRRQHVYLPNIGWCWETDEHPKVSMS